TCVRMMRTIRAAFPEIVQVYGGVYPTYHAEEILADDCGADFIVRGEGEATSVELLRVLEGIGGERKSSNAGRDRLLDVAGISFRDAGEVISTPDRTPIAKLDEFRIAWELIDDWSDYQCFGL